MTYSKMSNAITNNSAESKLSNTDVKNIVDAIVADLQKKNKWAENCFVELGTSLQLLYTDSINLTKSANSSVGTVSSDNNISGIIQEIAGHILTRFNNVKDINLDILSQVSNTSTLLNELANGIPEFRKIDKQLWILGSNMAIQSSGNAHTQKMFGEYSEELKQFSKSIKGLILDFQNDLKGMAESLQQVHSSIHSEVQRLNELIIDSKENITIATGQLEKLLSESATKIGIIELRSKQMSDMVTHIVTSIQFNDITRQQMEHVCEALIETAPSTNQFELYKCMRVQSAQLEQVNTTLTNAAGTISDSFEKIIKCGQEVAAQFVKNHNRATDNSPFTRIKNTLYELDHLLELSATLRIKSTKSLESAAVASEMLSSHLDKISEITGDLNLQAINALVMSRNIGSGGASLVALSKEVHSLSKESTIIVGGVVQTLREVGEQTQTLQLLMQKEEISNDSSQMQNGFQRLDEIGATYFAAIAHTSELAEKLKTDAHSIKNASQFIRELEVAISASTAQLNAAAEILSNQVIEDNETESSFGTRYTMESERMIHDRVQKELSGTHHFESKPAIIEQNENDEFGDFELF